MKNFFKSVALAACYLNMAYGDVDYNTLITLCEDLKLNG